jgi:uncharacterized protein YbaP (TraB family)
MHMRLNLKRLALRLLPAAVLMLALAGAAKAAPGLWVVRSGTATVYLFGTVHMLPSTTKWQSPAIERALAASDEIWTEADTSSLPELVRLIRRYGLTQQGNLRTVLPKRYRARYDMEMSGAGLSVDTFGHVKPWLAELLLTGGALKHARFGHGVETDLLAFAHRHDKATPTFETADEQFADPRPRIADRRLFRYRGRAEQPRPRLARRRRQTARFAQQPEARRDQ